MATIKKSYRPAQLHAISQDVNDDITLTLGDGRGADELVLSAKSNVDNKILNTKNIGTVSTEVGITVEEQGDGVNHVSKITIAAPTVFPAIAGGASLGVGLLLYTFPAGVISVKATAVNITLDEVDGNITADVPEVSVGNVIVVGAVATMTTATWENLSNGAPAAADCNGTATVRTVATSLIIETGDSHAVYLNIADGWAASGEGALPVTGTVTIEWTFLS